MAVTVEAPTPQESSFKGERELTTIRPSELVLDPQINRTVDTKWVDKLVETFNPLVLGAMIAWQHPDGTAHVVDGQHRKLACAALEYDEPVAVWLYTGLTVETANDLFLLANAQRNIHAIDKFLRAVAAGHPTEKTVAFVLNEYGMQVGFDAQDVGSPSALVSIYKRGGETLLRQIVGTLREAFPDDGVTPFQAPLLAAVASVERRYRKTEHPLEFDGLKDALATTTLVDLYNARDGAYATDPSKTRTWHMSGQLVKLYNATVTRSKKLAPPWYL